MNSSTNYLVEANSDGEDPAAMQAQQEAFSGLGDEIDVQQHLSKDMFTKPQTVTIDFDLIASPAELAQTPSKATWKLLPHLSKQLKQNMATRNRHIAGESELAGNLQRCVPLHLEIVQQKNDFPFAIGIKIPGMMDTNIHKDGQCVWRVPADTPTMLVGKAAFEPVNIINQYQYVNYRTCTEEDLSHAVQQQPAKGKTPAHAMVLVESLPYELMKKNLMAGKWQEELDKFDVDNFFNPGRSQLRVQVSEKMGKQIVELLEAPIRDAKDTFVNLNDLVVTFERADGVDSFISPKNINGEMIGTSQKGVSTQKLNTARLQKRSTFHIKAQLTYILF
jgi:hypothetical protein